MKRHTIIILGASALLLAGGAAAGVAAASGGNDTDTPITGQELEQASAAALAFTGGGTVTETEINDEESYYQVEVTLADGTQTDVQLDHNFKVVASKVDDENETDGADD